MAEGTEDGKREERRGVRGGCIHTFIRFVGMAPAESGIAALEQEECERHEEGEDDAGDGEDDDWFRGISHVIGPLGDPRFILQRVVL